MALSSFAQDCKVKASTELTKTSKDYILVPEEGTLVQEAWVIKLGFVTKLPKRLRWNQVAIPVSFNETTAYQIVFWKIYRDKQTAHTAASKLVAKYRCKDYQIITVLVPNEL